MNMLSRKLLGGAILVGSLGTATVASAGAVWNTWWQVGVTPGTFAYGLLNSARFSSDTTQNIGCWIDSYPAPNTGTTVGCYAQTAAGVSLQCVSSDPNIIAAARSINGDSLISFHVANGICTELSVQSDSAYIH